MGKMRSARSIIAKLVFAASCYFIWQERNNRFKKTTSVQTDSSLEDAYLAYWFLPFLMVAFMDCRYSEVFVVHDLEVVLKVECSPIVRDDFKALRTLKWFFPICCTGLRGACGRWKNLYAFLPNLSFVIPYYLTLEQTNKFYDFVDQTLAIRGDVPIQSFYLNCEYKCDYDRVYDLLCTLVGHFRLQQLVLIFPNDRFKVRFCWDLFRTCDTLVELTLDGYFVLDVPEYEVLFPCLKKISLVSLMYSGDHSLTNLVSGCPVLDELSVERNFDRMVTFKVSSVSLKRLRITFTKFSSGDYKVAVDAPNLEYLYVYDNMTNHYSFTNSLSLIEADIHHDAETIPEIIPFLSSTKTLKLTCHASWDLDLENVHGLNLPMFPNLVRLVTGWGLNMLPVLLNNMPNLEHITFLYLDFGGGTTSHYGMEPTSRAIGLSAP
ncbi:F-box/RNI-like/FBD-like domains-containing protein [Tanacetum coccineum]